MSDTEASPSDTMFLDPAKDALIGNIIDIRKHTILEKSENPNNDKEQLQELNLRLAFYIKKVRSLQAQNKNLEMKELSSDELTKINATYDEELNKLKRQVELQIKKSSKLKVELNDLKERLQNETLHKKEVQKKLTALKMRLNDSNGSRKVLENQIKVLHEEKEFQRKILEEKICILQERSIVEVDASVPNLGEILADIKNHFTDLAGMNKTEVEEHYMVRIVKQTMSKTTDELNRNRQEVSELTQQSRKHLRKIESLKLINETLNKQKKDMEECHIEEISGLKKDIANQKNLNIEESKEIVIKKREYENLNKDKLQLDKEIAIYRKLLEGEESRIKPNRGIGFQHIQYTEEVKHDFQSSGDADRNYRSDGEDSDE